MLKGTGTNGIAGIRGTGRGTLTRRAFARAGLAAGAGALALGAAGQAGGLVREARAAEAASAKHDAAPAQLPDAAPDPENPFGVDLNVNMDTIDDYLGIPGVAYRDMRMLNDPADYGAIGGDSVLSIAIEGFKVVPFPYVGTLQELPVSGAYDGDRLFDITWADDGTVEEATPRYEQAEQIVSDLFPQDEPIVVCCGGGGYAGMMRQLLIYLGYDASRVYNAGGVWDYTGYNPVELASYDADTDTTSYFMWRADVAQINFDQFTPLS